MDQAPCSVLASALLLTRTANQQHSPPPQSLNFSPVYLELQSGLLPFFPYCFPKACGSLFRWNRSSSVCSLPLPHGSTDALAPQPEKLPSVLHGQSSVPRVFPESPFLPRTPSLPPPPGNVIFPWLSEQSLIRPLHVPSHLEFFVVLCFSIRLPPLLLFQFTISFFSITY